MRDLNHDLRVEGAALERILAGRAAAEWARLTPAPGWTVAHQIAHLAWTDEVALLALAEPERFGELVGQAMSNADTFVDDAAEQGAAASVNALLRRWRTSRERLLEVLEDTDPRARVPWFGTSMRATSLATARIMETWAHGQDVADTFGIEREPTSRLRHVAHLGVRTRDFAYQAHGQTPPAEPFRYELTPPDGTTWSWGPAGAAQRIRGPALDFCLLVTQRRHPGDLALHCVGEHAQHWVGIAQAFAGPPGRGRAPGEFG